MLLIVLTCPVNSTSHDPPFGQENQLRSPNINTIPLESSLQIRNQESKRNVLILNSYTFNQLWADQIVKGISTLR